ncbi:MAG TPA: hypothetical protein VIW29_14395, partial [Polyangiaceae bacterium]
DLDSESITVPITGPEIWLVVRGAFELGSVSLGPARSAFVSADSGSLTVAGKGRIFRASVGTFAPTVARPAQPG